MTWRSLALVLAGSLSLSGCLTVAVHLPPEGAPLDPELLRSAMPGRAGVLVVLEGEDRSFHWDALHLLRESGVFQEIREQRTLDSLPERGWVLLSVGDHAVGTSRDFKQNFVLPLITFGIWHVVDSCQSTHLYVLMRCTGSRIDPSDKTLLGVPGPPSRVMGLAANLLELFPGWEDTTTSQMPENDRMSRNLSTQVLRAVLLPLEEYVRTTVR